MAVGLEDDRTIGQLVSDAARDIGELVRQEIELAKLETKQDLRRAARAGAMFGAAAVAGLLTAMLVAWALAWALDEVMPTGLAFLIVGLLFAAVTFVAVSMGRDRLRGFSAVPEETVETIKEDVEWLRARKS